MSSPAGIRFAPRPVNRRGKSAAFFRCGSAAQNPALLGGESMRTRANAATYEDRWLRRRRSKVSWNPRRCFRLVLHSSAFPSPFVLLFTTRSPGFDLRMEAVEGVEGFS